MRGVTKNLVLVLAIAVVLAGCKAPTQQIDTTKAALEEVTKASADIAPVPELKDLNDKLTAALDEIAAQDKKFFKKFGKAKEMLTNLGTDIEALKAALPAKIEAAKNEAIKLQGEAKAAIDEAKALLAKAPTGKGTKKDIDALKADLAGAETAFAEIQTALDGKDYIVAQDKANAIKTKAADIAAQVKAAIEKVTGKKIV
ncbi:MAG: hypothetical protein Q8O91_11875 [Candidatus Aminicenantes bacterium]|nr:hypothetical protein [Candidatus Aminicenantes bacterium]